MYKCSDIQKSLDWCSGRPVRPGIKRRAFTIAKDQIVKFPVLPVDSFGRPAAAKYEGDYELEENAKFKKIIHLANKAEFKSETQGEYPSQTFKVMATLVHPGIGEEAAEATSALLNSDNIVIVEDMEGVFRVIGNDKWETIITISRDHGQGAAGTAGTTINIEASDIVDCPIYTGKIVTEDGIINDEVAEADTEGED